MTMRILVVDEDPGQLTYAERALRGAGYVVVAASTTDEAVRLASTLQLHAALLDHGVNVSTGLAVLSALRRTQPSCLRILTTAHEDVPSIVNAVNQGEVLRVLPKPFTTETILSVVQEALDSSRRMAMVAASQLKAVHQQESRMLESCLREGLLRLAVQPIVRVDRNGHRAMAYEALLRSAHPVLRTPLAVLNAAEHHDRVHELGELVFHLSAKWAERIDPGVLLFVNVHPDQLQDRDRLDASLQPLTAHSDRVVLEMTERSPLTEIPGWEDTLDLLGDRGYSIAIDDLGAGYSSLSVLADLNPRFIKLDMSLVRNISRDPRKQRLVQLVQTFADATDASVIGEGVESAEEAAALEVCGIQLMQGYHFARPCAEHPPLSAVAGELALQG